MGARALNRWLRVPTEDAGMCKHCGERAVRLLRFRPPVWRRTEAQGGDAGFTFCRDCDCLAFAPMARA